ncbi:hypothetical protein FQR65_LT08325 [Abscondita terminalis]|nr:hypothetical protein FQR65_LT08325 [Abscondita terminalis]
MSLKSDIESVQNEQIYKFTINKILSSKPLEQANKNYAVIINKPYPVKNEIFWINRDILDLATNMKLNSAWFPYKSREECKYMLLGPQLSIYTFLRNNAIKPF